MAWGGRGFWPGGLAIAFLCWSGGAIAAPGDKTLAEERNAPKATLSPFRSDTDLRRYLKRVRPELPANVEMVTVTGSRLPTRITNTQETDVDEGGIVKALGDTLVILRRGRLFTVSTKHGELRPVDSIAVYAPGVDASDDWYDEMLITADRVIVIGFSYGRGGTEVNRFRLSDDGKLAFEDSYHLRSHDYYSSRNYASRLMGNRLVLYAPLYLPRGAAESFDWFPALRRWSGDAKAGFTPLLTAREIYVPRLWRDDGRNVDIEAVHTVMDCDVAAPVMNCRARSILGPDNRTFYVSSHAVYVWVAEDRWGRRKTRDVGALVYRLPLDGGAPSAIGVRGGPIDQFSFREDWAEGHLNVLVRSQGGGDAMWRPEFSTGAMALLQLPLNAFGNGGDEARRSLYQDLPDPLGDDDASVSNRFAGDYVVYGAGSNWDAPVDRKVVLTAANLRTHEVTQLRLDHGADRIELMGRDAVVVGGDEKDLHFRALELSVGSRPALGDVYTLRSAAQGETRSHAFFFKPESGSEDDGVLALPVARPARPAYHQLFENSAAILFLRRLNRKFGPVGELAARDENARDDKCVASCVDWYGNARPIFLGERTFALMGYEIVEGAISGNSIREIRRVDFGPR
jgi:hypothetical protein